MIAAFFIIGLIGLTFRGRNILERFFMAAMGLGAIGVVLFPHAYRILEKTGFFFVSGSVSIRMHFIFAGICFFSISTLCFIFALIQEETSKKHERNVVYISTGTLCVMASVVVAISKYVFFPPWTTLYMEFVLFSCFGISLFTCAGKISFLK